MKKTNEAKKAAQRAKFLSGIDKFMGSEPLPDSIKTRLDMTLAYNWYNYSCTSKQFIPWIIEFMKNSGKYTSNQISQYRNIPNSRVIPTVGAIARLINNGATIPQESIDWAHTKIAESFKFVQREEVKPVIVRPVVSVADRIKEKTYNTIGSIEEELDTFFMNNYESDFKPYDFMKKNDIKAVQATRIAEHYRPLANELQEVLTGRDAQLKEGYVRLNKAQIRRYASFVESIIEAAESIAQIKKATRKTRKPVEKSATQLTSKMKYLKESSTFKIASVDPTRIIRANTLIVFNTRYKKLGIYIAKNDLGLSVKGTTIQNFDETVSVSKTLRKPEEILKSVLNNSKASFNKMFAGIKTTASNLNGRINEDTILLRVF
jgi:hypothetical protein